jgi:mono/diheme cytochrome c family protein
MTEMRMNPFVLIAALVATPALGQEQGNAKAGEELAMAACSNCHLVAEGQSHHPMDSVPSFDAIAADQSLTADRLRTFLYKPHWPMPDFGLSRQQVEDEVAYLLELRKQRQSRR